MEKRFKVGLAFIIVLLFVITPLSFAKTKKLQKNKTDISHEVSKLIATFCSDRLEKLFQDENQPLSFAWFGGNPKAKPLLKEHFDAANSLVKIGEPSVIPLIKCLNVNKWYVPITTAWALGKIRDIRALDPLIEMLQSQDRIGPPQYTFYIGDMTLEPQKDMSLYDNPNSFPSWNLYFKRRAAAIALGNIGDKRAVEPLLQALKDDQSEVSNAAKAALKKITGEDF